MILFITYTIQNNGNPVTPDNELFAYVNCKDWNDGATKLQAEANQVFVNQAQTPAFKILSMEQLDTPLNLVIG